jgi:hypothetical protein
LEVAMIARAKGISTHQDRFLEMLPLIHEQASHAFRRELPERREELVAAVIANCWVAFVRLVDRGFVDVVYPTPLARFAIKQVRTGRRVGTKLNVLDISSKYCQRTKGVTLERLDVLNDSGDAWREVVVEDKTAGPAQIAATRIDFGNWLKSLPRTKRQIAKFLATGQSTQKTARKFHVSSGRVSQVRRELARAWFEFVGEEEQALAAATA